jgi:lipopolysaccharide transport system permease protein
VLYPDCRSPVFDAAGFAGFAPLLKEAGNVLQTLRRPIAALPAADDGVPVTIIERTPNWRLVDFHELWRYRELLFFLTWRDVKVRYKHTALGAAWAVLQPFGIMIVLSLFLSRVAAPNDREFYPLFVYAGLLPWTFFANAIDSASQSIIGSQNLVTKVYFPRLLIPLGAVGVHLVDLCVAFVTLLAMMVYYRVAPSWSLLWLPLITAGLMMAALGAGTLLSALTVAYRDFRYVLPFLMQFWLFATPASYVQVNRVIGPRWRTLLAINPAHGFILNFRRAVLGEPLDPASLGLSALVAVLLLIIGCHYFRQVERSFADII